MGLDNGIIVKSKAPISIPDGLQQLGEVNAFNKVSETYDTEVCYWRKWWGFRNEVIEAYYTRHPNYANEYYFDLDLIDLSNIYTILYRYNDIDYWNRNAESIWDWADVSPHMDRYLSQIRYLISLKMNQSELKIIFYDSY